MNATSRLFLAAGAAAVLLAGPAHAQYVDPATGDMYYDPTSFHVLASGASGSDPVLIHENTSFTITKNDGGAGINSPLTIYFAVPDFDGAAKPLVTSATFNGGSLSDPISSLFTFGSPFKSGDLYGFVGCSVCSNSLNFANLRDAEKDNKFGTPTSFTVYDVTIGRGFPAQNDFETISGLFPNGTIIAPFAENKVFNPHTGHFNITDFDTSWTNAGFIDGTPTVPEPRTWVMMLSGFGLMAAFGYRRQKVARYIEA